MEYTARSLKLKDGQGRVVNALTKADTFAMYFTNKHWAPIQGGRGGVHHRQLHRTEMVFEVQVHFDTLFTIHFEVWGSIWGGILQRANQTLRGP